MSAEHNYVQATRHPWASFLFVTPLLIGYEICVLQFGGVHPEMVRNGADNWLRIALAAAGVNYFWFPPVVLACIFAVKSQFRWRERPEDLPGVLSGMALESVVYALGLWAISRLLPSLLARWGIAAAAQGDVATPLGAARLVSYVGAGIYEESLFRLGIYNVALFLLYRCGVPVIFAFLAAAVLSAAIFSAAHHVGPYGQPYGNYVFLFRLAAGVYFALLYQLRGFGIAVGAHSCYNVMISVGNT